MGRRCFSIIAVLVLLGPALIAVPSGDAHAAWADVFRRCVFRGVSAETRAARRYSEDLDRDITKSPTVKAVVAQMLAAAGDMTPIDDPGLSVTLSGNKVRPAIEVLAKAPGLSGHERSAAWRLFVQRMYL